MVTAEGRAITMFCPNTGAMLGCSEPGSTVWFSASNKPTRKYRHTLEEVLTALGRVGVNTTNNAANTNVVRKGVARRSASRTALKPNTIPMVARASSRG